MIITLNHLPYHSSMSPNTSSHIRMSSAPHHHLHITNTTSCLTFFTSSFNSLFSLVYPENPIFMPIIIYLLFVLECTKVHLCSPAHQFEVEHHLRVSKYLSTMYTCSIVKNVEENLYGGFYNPHSSYGNRK